jgi:hypothetical protein
VSFTWFADRPLRTKQQVAAEIHQVSLARGLDKLATVLAVMCVSQEVGAADNTGERQFWCPSNQADPDSLGLPHDSLSDDGRSVGYFQQQKGPNGELWWGPTSDEMTLAVAANTFLDRLSDDYTSATDAQSANDFIQAVQRSGVPNAYGQWWDLAHQVVDAALSAGTAPVNPTPAPVDAPTPVDEPSFTETNLIGVSAISNNSQSRAGTSVDLLIGHTTEGSGGMNLVNYMIGAQVSYHYLIDNDEDGNTVYDLVDTDLASWSVLDANDRSINYVIGRSTVEWTRDDWLNKARKAVRIMAWLMIQDARKYRVQLRVLAPPYSSDPPGVTDHKYVTQYLGIGTHSDCGPNFPWDVLESDINELQGKEPGPVAGTPYTGSRSMYRSSNASIGTMEDVVRNIDGMVHEMLVEGQALMGEPASVALVQAVADGNAPGNFHWQDGSPDPGAAAHAKFILTHVAKTPANTTAPDTKAQ